VRLCIIAPLGLLELSCIGHYFFLLCSLCKYDDYVDFYKPFLAFKILDNDVYETGKSVPTEQLMSCAKRVYASEVIVPDVPLQYEENISLAKQFFSTLSKYEEEDFDFMYVPHAKTVTQVVRSAEIILNEFPFVKTLGVSKLWKPYFKRVDVIQALRYRFGKELHLLGFDDLQEAILPGLRSVDTSYPISQALAGYELPKSNNKAKRVDLTRRNFTREQRNLAARNCFILRTLCRP